MILINDVGCCLNMAANSVNEVPSNSIATAASTAKGHCLIKRERGGGREGEREVGRERERGEREMTINIDLSRKGENKEKPV